MSACCNHDCNQGRDCPAREGSTGLVTANSDGSSPHAPTRATTPWAGWDWIDGLRPLLLWALLLGGSAASALCLLLAYTGGSLCAR